MRYDFVEAFTDIDDELVTDVFPEAQRPVEIRPGRRSPRFGRKALEAAAACLAVVGIAVGAVFAVKSRSDRTADPNQTVSGTDVPNEGYPERAKYKYEGDFSELELCWNGCVERVPYNGFDKLAWDSELIVLGTFVDDARQDQPVTGSITYDPDRIFNGESFNKLRIDAVYKGDAEIGSEIVIKDSYYVNDGKLMYVSGISSTPMIKGGQWVYFLNKVSPEYGNYYYSTGGYDGRFPMPENENTFILADRKLHPLPDERIYPDVKKMLDSDPEVLRRIGMEYEGLKYNVVGYEELDGVKFTVGTTRRKYEAGSYIEVLAAVENTTDKEIGILLGHSAGTSLEVGAVLRHDGCELYNRNLEDLVCDFVMDSFIIQPGETCYQALRFSTYAQYYRPKDTIIADYIPLGIYNGEAVFHLLSDPYDVDSDTTEYSLEFEAEVVNSRTDYEFTMDEFLGDKFKCDEYSLFVNGESVFDSGLPMRINDLYLIDLNGDGKRELCSAVCIGFGIIDERVIAYDYANGKLYELADRGHYDYRIKVSGYGYEENEYCAHIEKYKFMTNECIWEKDFDISLMTEVKSLTTQIRQSYKGVTKVIGSAEDIGAGKSFEPDEFPGARITVTETAIDLIDKNGTVKRLFSNNMPIDGVYFVDLNADGRRELVAEYYTMPFVTPGSISYGPEKIFTLIDIENDRGYNMFSNGGIVEAFLTVIGDDLYIVKNGEVQSEPLTYERFLTKDGY